MGIHLSITSTVLPLFTMYFQKFVVSLTQFIYFVQTKIQILLYSIILSGGQLSGGQLSGVNCRGVNCRGVNCRGVNCRPPNPEQPNGFMRGTALRVEDPSSRARGSERLFGADPLH